MLNNKILVTGAYGLLGTTLCKKLENKGYNVIKHGRKINRDENFKINNFKLLRKNLNRIQPNYIINLAAFTDVDKCEKDISKAFELNVKFLENFNKYLLKKKNKCRFIHISTDQVYSGPGPHQEKNVNPINNYGLTKFLGELIITHNDALIIRTNFVGKTQRENRLSLTDWFLKNIKEKRKITLYNDIYFNPLEINYLAVLILKIMNKKVTGTFNLGSRQGISKANLLMKIGKNLKLNTKKCKISKMKASKKKAKRPKNMIMNWSTRTFK